MGYRLVCLIGVAAGTLRGIVGTGSPMMLMPILVMLNGLRHASSEQSYRPIHSSVASTDSSKSARSR